MVAEVARCLLLTGIDVVHVSRPIGNDIEGGAGAADKIIYISRAVRQLARPQEHGNMHSICFPSKAKCKFLPVLMTLCSSRAGRDQGPKCCQLPLCYHKDLTPYCPTCS